MRILTLTNMYPSPFDPHKAPSNRHQFRILGTRHPVRVISPIAWTVELRARRKGVAALPLDRMVEWDGLAVDHPRFYFPPKVLRQTYGPLFEASVQQTFRRRVAEFRPDLVYTAWAYPDGWAAVRMARRAALPVVVQVHGPDIGVSRHGGRRRRIFDTLRKADGVVAGCRDLARRVVEEGVNPDKVRVIYGGIDPAWFHPGPKLDARLRIGLAPDCGPVVLFVGDLLKTKGIEVLIDACAILAETGLRLQCRIIGRGPLAESLQARIDRIGLSERVKMLGAKPQFELPDWYRAADVLALPSLAEGVPNVLLEASACGLPCVATRVGGISEVSGHGDIRLIPPADPVALSGAIQNVLAGVGRSHTAAPARTRFQAVDELEEFLAGILARSDVRRRQAVGV